MSSPGFNPMFGVLDIAGMQAHHLRSGYRAGPSFLCHMHVLKSRTPSLHFDTTTYQLPVMAVTLLVRGLPTLRRRQHHTPDSCHHGRSSRTFQPDIWSSLPGIAGNRDRRSRFGN
jgi:hypothetical protein